MDPYTSMVMAQARHEELVEARMRSHHQPVRQRGSQRAGRWLIRTGARLVASELRHGKLEIPTRSRGVVTEVRKHV